MKAMIVRAGIGAVFVMIMAGTAQAGPVSSACNQSSRSAATPGLCACIQQVADQTLRSADQRRIATFFRNPDKAQDARMSQRQSDDAFWERYTLFGQRAEASCQG